MQGFPARTPRRAGDLVSRAVARRSLAGMPAYETIDLEVRDGVAHLTLNRPDAANGINLPLAQDLMAAVLAIAADPDGAGGAAHRRRRPVLRRRRPQGVRRPRRPAHPPPRDPRTAARGDRPARARRRAGGGRGAGERGRRGHRPGRRVRPRAGGRVGQVRDGLHRGRSHPRRFVELVPAPPRRPAAGARAHLHQPRAVGRRGAGVGADHRRWCPTTSSPREAEALAARLAGGAGAGAGRRRSGCCTRASNRRSRRTWRGRPRRSRRRRAPPRVRKASPRSWRSGRRCSARE